MTCKELATLMEGLGAHDALNFDGGGSTTMWIKGKGVVNHPSDGAQRVVANHLAIHAHGSGTPGSCDRTIDELDTQIGVYDAPASSDLDGDGQADACARSASGWSCSLSSGAGFGGAIAGPKLSDASGWNSPIYYGTLRVGDVNGDGKADLCARAAAGVQCWPSTASGYGAAIAGPKLDNAGGYNLQRYGSTIRLADFNGDGKADLCVRTTADFRCYPSTGSGFGAAVVGPKLSDASGWDAPSCYGTLRMGDVNGDGKADLCGRCKAGVSCWLSTGTGFGNAIAGPAWSDASGWASLRFFGTLRLADVNGDGKADLCARSASDYRCVLSTGAGFMNASPVIGPKLSDSGGWGDYDHFSTIRMADVTGDGRADVCARGGGGVSCWPSTGNGFGAGIAGPALSDTSGWSAARYFRTIRAGDINGDRKADLCARSSAGLSCWTSTGAGFSQAITGPAWSNAAGWDDEAYYSTIRIAGPPCVKSTEICDGKDNDCDGAVDEGVCGDAGPPSADLGVPADAGDGGAIPAGDGWLWGDGATGDAEPWFELGPGGDGGGSNSSGCGCATPGQPAAGPPVALLIVALVLLARRRTGR
jgi:MYXO-CTERM domain-containing protein